jgi:hypothetical protein
MGPCSLHVGIEHVPRSLKDQYGEPERGEWMGADKNSSRRRWRLQQDEHGFQHTSPTHYQSWRSPCSHWGATGPRNQQTTFRAKTHQHAQRKLARLAACAALVKPVTPVRPLDSTDQAGGYSSRTTSVPESLSDFSRPWNKTLLKHNLHRRKTLHKT